MRAPSNDPAAQRAAAAVADATGAALQGDAVSALAMLSRVPEADFEGDAQTFRRCMFERFGGGAPPALTLGDDPWIAAVGRAYVTYWRSALTKAVSIDAAEATLASTVGQLVGRPSTKAAELDDLEPDIVAAIEGHGLHALLGRTLPLRELMLWRRQTVLVREVDLPGGRESVTVNLLDDFLLRGWGYYATCGHRSAGGWATDAALFAVVPAYHNLDHEVFSVRFLGHEAQHFADQRAFPGMESWELEYRAKLVELSMATDSQRGTLKLFCENRAETTTSPHGYANAKLIGEVARGLSLDEATLCGEGALPAGAIRALARELLIKDTAARQVPGAATAPGIR